MNVRAPSGLALKAKLFRGLSDPSRLALIEALRDGEKTVSQLVEATGLSQPNASAHLACLRDCGIVEKRQAGRYAFYALADDQVEALLCAAEELLARIGAQIFACTRYRQEG
ncbi:ArsR/SmtB family transcription factor [Kallotenue papyrolyticum]|uniref:ArsR/SmtB family transcription factor n=1 Tax=Kallotenue papyrolyticum TaxID=1325125 RepID=UPI00049232D6|nr:metalloregulator ArsR/SmtB family transcription factor [Kallotenue papyrolyticum]